MAEAVAGEAVFAADGVLELTLPKTAASKTPRIPIS